MIHYCSSCRSPIPEDSRFCPICGAPVQENSPQPIQKAAGNRCPSCGTVLTEDLRFCTACGANLKKGGDIQLANEKKQQYEAALQEMLNARDEAAYRNAAKKLKAFAGFEKADAYYAQCMEKAEAFRKDGIYKEACEKAAGNPDYKTAMKALTLFTSIAGWKDAREQIEKLKVRMVPLKADRDKKMKKIRRIAILVGILVFILTCAGVALKIYLDKVNLSTEFDTVVSELDTQKDTLTKKIASAQERYDAQTGSQDALNILKTAIDDAKKVTAPTIPEKAFWPSQLRTQISDLNKGVQAYKDAVTNLETALSDLDTSIENQKKIDSMTSCVVKSTVKNSDGYQFQVTWTLGKWIKASDTAQIEEVWKTLGGTSAAPTISKFGSGSGYTTDKAMILIGTCQMTNVTEGYDITGSSDVSATAGFNVCYLKTFGSSSYDYSTSAALYLDGESNCSSYCRISADFSSNSWGPKTFAIAVPSVFLPSNTISPSEYYLKFDDDTTAAIGISW